MPTAEAKGVDLRLGAHPGVIVTADPRRIEQILLNLLSNAVKFTPAGGAVTVDASVGHQAVEVRVADTGSGIRADFLPHVFDRFRQEENSTARSKGGLGLGLFIARQLVDALGGSIRAESAGPGLGSRFVVALPFSTPGAARKPTHDGRSAAAEHAARTRDALTGVRVLLVEDEADVRELMLTALERAGARVIAVESARLALKALHDSEVDVLLADIAMPGQDGYDLIRAVRALPARVSHIPAAAVTACARDDERQRALAAGFQLHVAKPLEPAALIQAVATLLDQSAARC
jgi:CheY-like chemotaxis protein